MGRVSQIQGLTWIEGQMFLSGDKFYSSKAGAGKQKKGGVSAAGASASGSGSSKGSVGASASIDTKKVDPPSYVFKKMETTGKSKTPNINFSTYSSLINMSRQIRAQKYMLYLFVCNSFLF
jgi:hypothetical protein